MRLADYTMRFLADRGIRHVFLVTGGGAMHLNDAVGRETRWTWVCNHHEQASAIAAESYARLSNRMALLNVTTGPGGVNALNGVYGAFTDSIPMFVLSGQVKRETIAGNSALPLRQLGDQEVDIIPMVKPVTKYAVCVQDPATIRYHLEKAWHLALGGRPGPVWLDIPIDVQGSQIDPDSLTGYNPAAEENGGHLEAEAGWKTGTAVVAEVEHFLEKLKTAERPVLFAGAGVRLAGARDRLLAVAAKLGVPLVSGWNAHDLVPNDHPSYAGRPGTVGDRQGNFTVQNSDLLLVLGSRLNIRQISYNWKGFARAAYKIMVDIDKAELAKPTLSIDRPVHAEVGEFLTALETAVAAYVPQPRHGEWLAWCRKRAELYPVVQPEYSQADKPINPYVFAQRLFEALPDDGIVVTANAMAALAATQAGRIKANTRLFSNSGCASMGYDLPAAIGAYYASGKPVTCLAGDGSIMMNIQELQTILCNRLPIKIMLLNNNGYLSIRQTQSNYFPDNPIGCDMSSGVSFPDFSRLAEAWGFPTRRCESLDKLAGDIDWAMSENGPAFLEIMQDTAQGFSPKLASRALPNGQMSSPALEDMFPFLPREELAANMLIPLLDKP